METESTQHTDEMSGRRVGNRDIVQPFGAELQHFHHSRHCSGQPELGVQALRGSLEIMEVVGKVEALGRLTYKGRLSMTAVGSGAQQAPH